MNCGVSIFMNKPIYGFLDWKNPFIVIIVVAIILFALIIQLFMKYISLYKLKMLGLEDIK